MAGPDLSVVTAAVDFGSVVAAVVSVFAALVVVFVAWKGAKMVLCAVGGGGGTSFKNSIVRDAWEGYTFADDARDRAAAGLTVPSSSEYKEWARVEAKEDIRRQRFF